MTWCWEWGSLFRASTIEFEPLRVYLWPFRLHLRPFWVNFGPVSVNFGLYKMILGHRKLILDVILDLWETILESGCLCWPLRYNCMPCGVISRPLGFDFWPRWWRVHCRLFQQFGFLLILLKKQDPKNQKRSLRNWPLFFRGLKMFVVFSHQNPQLLIETRPWKKSYFLKTFSMDGFQIKFADFCGKIEQTSLNHSKLRLSAYGRFLYYWILLFEKKIIKNQIIEIVCSGYAGGWGVFLQIIFTFFKVVLKLF